MGSICSKESPEPEKSNNDNISRENELNKSSVQLVAPADVLTEDFIVEVKGDVSVIPLSRQASQANVNSSVHQRKQNLQIILSKDLEEESNKKRISRLSNPSDGDVSGWPSWLASVAGDVIQGWVPRQADSFEKLGKIGQGTYSSVYKARDLVTGKIVALKKVRFVNMDPESVRFMAREIYILRKLDHPNIIKLEGLVTSRVSSSLYLVFEYMEHDLAGLAAAPTVKFTESQIKCYMQQLLHGLEHCHSRGVLHRDIKGSNLLIDNNGVLKIGDFGLATLFDPDQNQPLTSRVVTLWYRAPELLLGSTEYGAAIDLWSYGCILAELFVGKPIMPGRTEVEQMHKIFKLCGSPPEDYWKKTKLPLATSFKPQQPYKSRLADMFRNISPSAFDLIESLLSIQPEDRGSARSALGSKFFKTEPLPCDPKSLPKYPPSKEFDAKLREEEAKRKKADTVNRRGPESARRGSRDSKLVRTPEYNTAGDIRLQGQANPKTVSHKLNPQEDGGSGFTMVAPSGAMRNGYTHSSSMVHSSGSTWTKPSRPARTNEELRALSSVKAQPLSDLSVPSIQKDDRDSDQGSGPGYRRNNRIHHSGPLVPPGSNMEDMLKEHERLMQQAFRKARLDKHQQKLG